MNWLAHLYLARQTPLDRLGQLSGDFVRGPVDDRLHPQIRRGVREHRALDTWIDDHPEALDLRRRMPQGLRRFAGIATDLIVDHVLARDWETYEATRSLESFARQVADDVQTHLEFCPERLADKGRRLDIGNLLVSYRRVDGLDLALERISRRLRRSVDLHPITTWFETHEESVSAVARTMIRDARCFLAQRRRFEDPDGSLVVPSRRPEVSGTQSDSTPS